MPRLGKRIHSYGISAPRTFQSKIRCHIDPTTQCYDKSRCATCKVAREHRQQFLIQPQLPKKTRRKRSKQAHTSNNPSISIEVTDETKKEVMCAYCLYKAQLAAFLISTKKGFHRSQAKCPDCGNGQLIKTLTADMTPEQYAEWIYSNKSYGIWQKMPFNKWKERLFQIGWAGAFWNKYKQLKAGDETETYEEALNRQAYEEWLREHGEEE